MVISRGECSFPVTGEWEVISGYGDVKNGKFRGEWVAALERKE